jgi:hypothetical protein
MHHLNSQLPAFSFHSMSKCRPGWEAGKACQRAERIGLSGLRAQGGCARSSRHICELTVSSLYSIPGRLTATSNTSQVRLIKNRSPTFRHTVFADLLDPELPCFFQRRETGLARPRPALSSPFPSIIHALTGVDRRHLPGHRKPLTVGQPIQPHSLQGTFNHHDPIQYICCSYHRQAQE